MCVCGYSWFVFNSLSYYVSFLHQYIKQNYIVTFFNALLYALLHALLHASLPYHKYIKQNYIVTFFNALLYALLHALLPYHKDLYSNSTRYHALLQTF